LTADKQRPVPMKNARKKIGLYYEIYVIWLTTTTSSAIRRIDVNVTRFHLVSSNEVIAAINK